MELQALGGAGRRSILVLGQRGSRVFGRAGAGVRDERFKRGLDRHPERLSLGAAQDHPQRPQADQVIRLKPRADAALALRELSFFVVCPALIGGWGVYVAHCSFFGAARSCSLFSAQNQAESDGMLNYSLADRNPTIHYKIDGWKGNPAVARRCETRRDF